MDRDFIHPAEFDDATLLKRCARSTGRGSGPGGQHRNKVETAVRLRDEPTGLEAQASERRSQAENQRVALRRLRLKLAIEHRATRPAGSVPSALWASRARDGKIAVNVKHADYPVLLAEALDVLGACRDKLPAAAALLGISSSQLIKLIGKEPGALTYVNAQRAQQGLHAFKA